MTVSVFLRFGPVFARFSFYEDRSRSRSKPLKGKRPDRTGLSNTTYSIHRTPDVAFGEESNDSDVQESFMRHAVPLIRYITEYIIILQHLKLLCIRSCTYLVSLISVSRISLAEA
jgi:hypothetical protein